MSLLLDDIDVPVPGPGEVGVKIVATGLCHTDIAGMQGAIGLFPIVFGHEGAGIVEAVGPDVTEFKIGKDFYETLDEMRRNPVEIEKIRNRRAALMLHGGLFWCG